MTSVAPAGDTAPPQPVYPSTQPPPPHFVALNPHYGNLQPPVNNVSQNQMAVNLLQAQIQAQQEITTVAVTVEQNDPEKSPESVKMKCPACNAEITTNTTSVIGTCVLLWCILLACTGLILFIWAPFVMDCSKDVLHTCPNCNAECGRWVQKYKPGKIRHRSRGGFGRRNRPGRGGRGGRRFGRRRR